MTNTITPNWTVTATIDGETIALDISAARYTTNNRLALQLYVAEGEDAGELYDDLTINSDDIILFDADNVAVINPNINNAVVQAMIDGGFLEAEPFGGCAIGGRPTAIYELTDKAWDWVGERANSGQ